nr:MAG TPA: hypothetical protein [Caudoviricetes sp.]
MSSTQAITTSSKTTVHLKKTETNRQSPNGTLRKTQHPSTSSATPQKSSRTPSASP